MEKAPMEWVERIFVLMEQFFGDEWATRLTNDHDKALYKTQWQTGLTGLTKEEIKKALKVAKYLSITKQKPPNVVDFYHYSKGVRLPVKKKEEDRIQSDPVVARNAINEIRKHLS